MLRRWRSFKKIIYAAAILLLTILLYATTSHDEYIDEAGDEWKLPVVSDGTLRVDKELLEPLHRLPLGPFKEQTVPVLIETLNLQMPSFVNNSKPQKPTLPPKPPAIILPKLVPPVNKPAPPAAIPPKPLGSNPVAGNPPAPPPKLPANSVQGAPAVPNAASAPKPQPPAGGGGSNSISNIGSNAADAAKNIPKPQPTSKPKVVAVPKPPPPPPLPLKPLPDLTKTALEMERRLSFTKSQCEKYKFPHEVDADIYVLTKYNISYCKVPKSGSTYWEQVFSFLNKDPRQLSYLKIKSPFQISKYDIRYTSHFTLPRHNWKIDSDKSLVMKTKKILFVRHPLERLWSSYMEKFFLIDFWSSLGLRVKTKGADPKCPKSISFREFIDFTLPIFNEFWAPITELCNPCTYKPHFIGHIETMREDSLYILKDSNLQWVFTEQERITRHESHMVDMIIYNYQIHSIQWYSFFHHCFTQKDLATRLWEVFKKIGYLSSHAILPGNLPDYNQTTVIKEARMQAAKFHLGGNNGRAQQLKIMKRDYEGLPKPIMAKILEKYAMDFELFGYSTDIPAS